VAYQPEDIAFVEASKVQRGKGHELTACGSTPLDPGSAAGRGSSRIGGERHRKSLKAARDASTAGIAERALSEPASREKVRAGSGQRGGAVYRASICDRR